MADISQYLRAIKIAKYGEEVRGSIHDAIEAMNEESSAAKEAAETAKDSAKASAAEAKTSETKAKTSETNAKSSETKAKTSETNAANSASDAAASALAAKSSENEAKEAEEVIKQFALYLSFFDAIKEVIESCAYPSLLLDSDGEEILDSNGVGIFTEAKGLDGFKGMTTKLPTDVFALSEKMKHCITDSTI